MRLAGDGSEATRSRAYQALDTAIESGINHFDHADIYGQGRCEEWFGDFLRAHPGLRDQLIITSKCGIRMADQPQVGDPQRYDFSRAHILRSVEGSLSRLGVERLDCLLLHRPDFLMDPDEVAATFEHLHAQGQVAFFGVSNFTPDQVELLQSSCSFPLMVNQVEFNLNRIDPLYDGTLSQCMRRRITCQSWSPLAGACYAPWQMRMTEAQANDVRQETERQAQQYGVGPDQVVLAWLLAHPARIAPVIGTLTPERIRAAVGAVDLTYGREDWYRLLAARVGPVA